MNIPATSVRLQRGGALPGVAGEKKKKKNRHGQRPRGNIAMDILSHLTSIGNRSKEVEAVFKKGQFDDGEENRTDVNAIRRSLNVFLLSRRSRYSSAGSTSESVHEKRNSLGK